MPPDLPGHSWLRCSWGTALLAKQLLKSMFENLISLDAGHLPSQKEGTDLNLPKLNLKIKFR